MLSRPLARLLALALTSAACAPTVAKPMPPSTPAPTGPHPDIVQAGHPVLRGRAAELAPERIATPEIQDLVERMIETMRAAPGVGLAAPQIGVPLRILVLEDRPELMARLTPAELRERERVELPVHVVINPELRPIGADTRTFFEGCLSVNGYTALVERHAEVEVTGLDRHGHPQTLRVRGWPARILQHEVDHLDGTLYIDRMLSRSFSTGDQARARFAGRPIADILGEFSR
ncbi:peptide deformylase [Nannocystis bainbridge]|uniref:Peptide deformylase n=1 Tax=Nannocystis bainbridge TaxID=2995303 RepID=A0ABT5E3Y9_9BACT|nr:peptide deformylase [Nannocystis bainbridge]MDC0719446.1 peptide deformylase [Nannocystis bainbridge]